MVAVQTACTNYDADDHKFGNVVYLDVAETSEVQAATIKNTLDVFDRTFAATLAYPSDQDVTLYVTVDPSLVERYNARYGTAWPMLDAKYYALSSETATIAAGKTTSETLTLHLQNLLGEGAEQTGALPLDETYLVPVTIAQSSVPTLATSSTVYYVVKRSSNITVAAQLGEGNWINFPTLDTYGTNSQAWNGLTAVTYEALIYIDQFATSTVTSDGNTNAVNISSVMGVEQYLLLRIGDTNFEQIRQVPRARRHEEPLGRAVVPCGLHLRPGNPPRLRLCQRRAAERGHRNGSHLDERGYAHQPCHACAL